VRAGAAYNRVGAGTLNPATFLRVLGPEPWRASYVEPSKRPRDGRYGENPNRVQQFLQYQVILKPPPANVLELYIESLRAIGIDPKRHDIRLVEDDWEAPTLGAAGLGWEVWLDGMEITQFTYFQQAGSLELEPITAEITYGLLRLCLYLQHVESVLDVHWGQGVSWGEMNLQAEQEFSAFHFEHANAEMYFRIFADYEREAARMIEAGLVLPAYDYAVKLSHVFNLLDARGAISVTERTGYIGRIRALARKVAVGYIAKREALGFPIARAGDGLPRRRSPRRPGGAHECFVLEIGAENIPASYVPPAIAQLAADAAALLARERIVHGGIYTTGTPRRLVLIVSGMAPRQAAGEELVTGPPVSRAFGEDGKPTPAAEGFARGQGIAVSKLERVATPKGEYLAVRKRLAQRGSATVLKEQLPALVAGLKFPKSMKWEASGARFARPLRWMLSLYGRDVVRFRVADVESGRVTHARPWMRGERAAVADATDYLAVVAKLGVVLDHAQRAASIGEQAHRAAAAHGWKVVEDDDLVTELAFMTEDPRLLAGSFDTRYLDLPQEVIVVAMRSHQRYVAVTDTAGKLVPRFFTFTDGPVEGADEVVRGNERVLRARLEDAEFYWREDVKRGVDGLAAELDRIVFIEGWGRRSKRRVLEWRKRTRACPRPRRSRTACSRAARLAKADLSSTMIRDGKEFTALRASSARTTRRPPGRTRRWQVIRDHYAPRAGDLLPSRRPRACSGSRTGSTPSWIVLSGQKPTGSQDPFAIRRSANGVVRIAAELAGARIDEILELSGRSYGSVLDRDQFRTRWQEQRVAAGLPSSCPRGSVPGQRGPVRLAAAVMPAGWRSPRWLSRARAIAKPWGTVASSVS
jgi:glycyl-tRNA synthetase